MKRKGAKERRRKSFIGDIKGREKTEGRYIKGKE
jgi:hypothetical protein